MDRAGLWAGWLCREGVAIAVAIALVGCGEEEQSSYPTEAVETFVAACAAEAGAQATPGCRCIIDEIAKYVPYDEFEAMDREAARGTVLPDFADHLAAAAEACRTE